MQNTTRKTTQFMQPLIRLQPTLAWYQGVSRVGLTSLSLAMILNLSAHADIPVESGSLSQPTAPIVSTDSDQTSQLWQLTQKVQKLEEEVRNLRGKVEDHDNDIDQLQKDAKNHFVDFDQRLGQVQDDVKKLNGTATPPAGDTTAPQSPNSDTPNPVAPTNTTSNTAAPATDEADKVAYIAAYEAYKTGGAAQAIVPMKKFITDYPQSQFVPNAYYWLGEFNLAVTPPNFAAASANFKIVMNQYPKTAKAAAATYRLATLADVDQHQATAITLMKSLVKNYPGTQEAGFATDYLKSHATTATDKKSERTEVKKTENSDKTQSHKAEATEKHKKPVKKVKDSDSDDANT